jgi:hypothetical protein
MFENSTVCHAIYVVVICLCSALDAVCLVFGVLWVFGKSMMILANAGFVLDTCWVQLFMESLILAQDERWRRA